MSTGQAIEAVTLTLRSMLTGVSANVTARPLDRARTAGSAQQINLFLYEVAPNGALRNTELPTQRGSSGLHPPLALDLRYLLTAYSDTDEDATAHRLLGEAMLVLHNSAVIPPALLEGLLAAAGVHLQCERIRLTPVHLSSEEVSKLWTSFQVNFRLSVAYQASVLLIDGAPGVAALPVLRRGRQPFDAEGRDQGPRVSSGAAPRIDRVSVEAWRGNLSFPARTGDRLVIEGVRLGGQVVDAVFRHPRLAPDAPIVAAAAVTSDTQVVVALPAGIPPGFATVAVRLAQGADPPLVSNTLAFPIATRLGAIVKNPAGAGAVDLVVPCDRVVDDQAAVLLVGDRQVPATLPVAAGSDLTFRVAGLTAVPTTAVVRVRVDGVDSVPLPEPDPDPTVPLPLAFDPAQEVTLP